MQQVSDWLEKLGLAQYAQRFAENDIDFALFTKLTDVDLKELGVASLGHRKLLLEAIAERAAAALPNVAEPKPPQDTAERRQCPPSALVGQIRRIEEGSVSGSS
jgi:SAM domain (Sterile alpha motif)